MDFTFSDDQELFRSTVRDLLADRCPPSVVRAAWDDPDGSPSPVWAPLADMGVVGLLAPESAGGLGMDEVDLVLLLEETGRAALPDPLVEHSAVAVPALRDVGGPHGLLEAAASGDRFVGVGLDGATHVLGADRADALILQHGGELHLVTVDRFSVTPIRSVDGTRRLAAVEWSPGPDSRLVSGDAATSAVALAFDRGALGTAAQLVGLGRAMIDLTVGYVGEREQFGKPVGSYQAVKHHLANALLEVEFAAPLVYAAAWAVANDTPDRSRDVSMAKATASDAARTAARTALQCHGAIGYTVEYDLHMWMKRAWALAAAWGHAEWHRERVSHSLGLAPDNVPADRNQREQTT